MKRINVFTKLKAKEQKVSILNGVYLVSVKSPPKDGKANEELCEVLCKYFNVPKSRVSVDSGHKSRNKIVVVDA